MYCPNCLSAELLTIAMLITHRNAYDKAFLKLLSGDDDANTLAALQTLFPSDDCMERQELSLVHRTVLNFAPLDLGTVLANSPRSEIDKGDASGRTAFWWATHKADCEAMSLLQAHGADINVTSTFGYSPLGVAIFTKNHASIGFLLQHDCDLDYGPHGLHPIHDCARHGPDLDIIEAILARRVDVDATSVYEKATALMIAVQTDHHYVSEFLIARGADVNKINIDGESALHIAIQYNSYKSLKLLLMIQANLETKTRAGEGILHYAAEFADMECLQILRAHDIRGLNIEDVVTGCSPQQRFKDMKGLNALQVADKRDDIPLEWHTMFYELVHGIKFPESKHALAGATVHMEEFHDALEELQH